MHDLAFVGFLAALIAAGFRKPFLFILVYVYIDVVSPQRLSYFLLNAVPISLIAVVLAVAGWAVADDKRDVRLAPRQFLILLLLIYCWLTTRSEEHTSELQSLMRISYAVFCLKKQTYPPVTPTCTSQLTDH